MGDLHRGMRPGARAAVALLIVAYTAFVSGRETDVINKDTNTLHGVHGERLNMNNGKFKNKRAKTAGFDNVVVGTKGGVYSTEDSVYPLVWRPGHEHFWHAVVAIIVYVLYQLTFVQGVHLQRVALSEENVIRNVAWTCIK